MEGWGRGFPCRILGVGRGASSRGSPNDSSGWDVHVPERSYVVVVGNGGALHMHPGFLGGRGVCVWCVHTGVPAALSVWGAWVSCPLPLLSPGTHRWLWAEGAGL